MLQLIKNIVRICIVGFIFVGVSGVTVVIQHDHPIDASSNKHTEQSRDEQADEHQQSKSSTYHEVHFVKLGSYDKFTISPTTECRASLVALFVIHPDSFDSFSTLQSAAVINIADKETSPPSVDKCVLFCSFLI